MTGTAEEELVVSYTRLAKISNCTSDTERHLQCRGEINRTVGTSPRHRNISKKQTCNGHELHLEEREMYELILMLESSSLRE